MKIQMLVPLHTYPMSNENEIALHAAAVARHLDADVHALVLKANFPRVSSALGNMLIDVPAMIGDAKEKCRLRGEELVQASKDETGPSGISLRITEIEFFLRRLEMPSLVMLATMILLWWASGLGRPDRRPPPKLLSLAPAGQHCWFRKRCGCDIPSCDDWMGWKQRGGTCGS